MRLETFIRNAKKINFLLPKSLKIWIVKKHQQYVFKRALHEFCINPENLKTNDQLVNRLIYGWGNQGWSAFNNYTKALVVHALETEGPILECGSGLSTILLGIVAQKRNIKVFSLENNNFWGEKIRRHLAKYNIKNVYIDIHPLKNYGEFEWYNPSFDNLPEHFSLVICDGPPASTLGGRYGLLPIMITRLPNCTILLDDFSRKDEQEIAKKWSSLYNLTIEQLGNTDIFAKITII